MSYEDIKKRFDDVGCTLLVTKEEFLRNHMTTYSEYKFTATCGHERTAILTNTKLKNDMLCKECSAEIEKKKRLENCKHTLTPQCGTLNATA